MFEVIISENWETSYEEKSRKIERFHFALEMKNFYSVAQLCLLAPVLVGSQSQYTYNYNQVRPVRSLESELILKKKKGAWANWIGEFTSENSIIVSISSCSVNKPLVYIL